MQRHQRTVPARTFALVARAVILSSLLTGCERRGKLEPPICDVNEAGISDSTIGPLHIDEAVRALRVRCPAVGDTLLAVLGSPASVPALRLIVVGAPVIIRHDGAKVTALRVESPVFQTNDALGVGTSVARFKNQGGVRVSKAGATPYGVLLDRRRCGVAYELSGWGAALPPTESDPPLSGTALLSWPDSIVVRAVTVSGCRGMTRDLGVDSVAEALATLADSGHQVVDSGSVAPMPPPVRPPDPEPAAKAPRADTVPGRPPITPAPPTAQELSELSARLDVPVQGITRPQLRDTYTEARGGRVHEAMDIPAARGTPVIAATDGRVLKLFNSKAGGLMVYSTDASERFVLLYGHLDRYAEGLTDGTRLERGQVIGYVGTTGNAPVGTPHLHFAILRGRPSASWWAGVAVNPYPLLVPARR